MTFKKYPENKPKINQVCLCRCYDWVEEGYKVAKFNRIKFDEDGVPNDLFDSCIDGFVEIYD